MLTLEDVISPWFYSGIDKIVKSLWSENRQKLKLLLFNPLFRKHFKRQNGLKADILSGAMSFRKAEHQLSSTFLIKYAIKKISVAPKASQPS